MPFGFAGKEFEIHLTKRIIKKNYSNVEHYTKFLGGRGIATKMFVERISPDTDPFSPHNPLIFSAGLLTETLTPGANRTTLVTRSPQTGLLTYSTIGGLWGPEFKQTGYDTLIISGISDNPVYLFIKDDHVELLDASHLWGNDVLETKQMLKDELKLNKIQMKVIRKFNVNRSIITSAILQETL
jgi:aldehyde:ferredoxin oxidoreductase